MGCLQDNSGTDRRQFSRPRPSSQSLTQKCEHFQLPVLYGRFNRRFCVLHRTRNRTRILGQRMDLKKNLSRFSFLIITRLDENDGKMLKMIFIFV